MKGRLAPTPSGYMHLGNAFSALLSWLSVRSQGGQLLLRIEDLDQNRSRPEYVTSLLNDFSWLGLDWDEGPIFQSDRTPFYEKNLTKLKQNNLLYPCFCTRKQLHAASAPHESDGLHLYNGHCRRLPHSEFSLQHYHGTLRVKVPSEDVFLHDTCFGPYTQNLARDCGDFILRRSDGVYAYQLATPADDGDMHITEVVRGRDLLSSSPRQIWLMQKLGYTPPQFCHVPLLLAPDGRRLAKRDRDLEIAFLRENGWHAPHLIGLLAFWAGLLPKWEAVYAKDLIAEFKWNKITIKDIYVPEILDVPSLY